MCEILKLLKDERFVIEFRNGRNYSTTFDYDAFRSNISFEFSDNRSHKKQFSEAKCSQ